MTTSEGELSGALLAVSQSIMSRKQLAKTLDAILNVAQKLISASHGIVYVLDETGQSLVPNIVHHNEKTITKHSWDILQLDTLSDNDPLGYSVKSNKVVMIDDLYQYSGFDCDKIYQTEQSYSIRSRNFTSWPLVNESKNTMGLLVLFDFADIENRKPLQVFCQLAANCIYQAIWLEKYSDSIHDLGYENAKLIEENKKLKAFSSSNIIKPIASSKPMSDTLQRIEKTLHLPIDILLLGETGTGKEVIAQYIHTNSNRKNRPYIIQNCAAIPEQLLESELFGHKKGSFTGANKDQIGLFEAAQGGTLFLDEIGDMPLPLQAKLLRVLQEKKIKPVGSQKEIEIDVRIIAATHCDLAKKIQTGEFRADLYYRLSVFPVSLPPLRQRREDILPLAEHFIQRYSTSLGLPDSPSLSNQVRKQLLNYTFPGNVRELKHIVERAILLSDFNIVNHIELEAQNPVAGETPHGFSLTEQKDVTIDNKPSSAAEQIDIKGLKESVNAYERQMIINCLQNCNWQVKKAAEKLSLPLSTLSHKIKKFEINA